MTTEEKLSLVEQERDSFASQLTELRGCYERLMAKADTLASALDELWKRLFACYEDEGGILTFDQFKARETELCPALALQRMEGE